MIAPDWTPPDEFEEYQLVRMLGRGAMGAVYLARDALLDRPVALKFVQAAADPIARARLFDEARAIARLQHPNVVAIHRVAEVAGHPYLVSEYVRGRPLDQLDRPVASQQVIAIALDLARGLAAAHRCGVLHRDVKPANAMLADDGRAKLLDFGLARVVDVAGFGGPGPEPVAVPPRERSSPPPGTAVAATPPEAARWSVGDTLPVTSESASGSPVGLTQLHHVIGTPLYMAPELWRGEPATRRTDLYALGILLYELLTGDAPHGGVPLPALCQAIQDSDPPRLADVSPGIDPALAAIVDRLVERDPGARFASADALVVALDECASPPPAITVPDGNPYRGLAAFESAHASLFFGRRGEIRELVHRVRSEAFVVVGGDSGTGKSSLCRAGVLPWLVDNDGWSRVDVIPGRHPVRSLAAALAPWLDSDEAELDALLRDTPDAFARAVRQRASPADRPARRLLLFVDQLEELLTLSEPAESCAVAAALAALAVHVPAVRVLATGRSDFLWRLAMLPGLGDELARGLYFLRPLTGERIREVIVRPAAAKGVAFEPEALVDTLVEQTELAPGGLPLLQFTLAELWDARDAEARTIRTGSLAALGGVAGALTRHADRLLAGLDADGQEAARRILLRLVTAEGTRARRSEAELLTSGAERRAERAALEVLVRGRVVVASATQRGAYELAHEALLVSWPTLQGWLRRGAAEHALRVRVEHAAAEWERLERPRDLLWGHRRLAETRALPRATMAPGEAAFLAASRAAVVRTRMLALAAAAVAAIAVVAIGVAVRARDRRQLEAVITDHVRAATAAFDDGGRLARERDDARVRAFDLFDTRRWRAGEDAWNEVEALAAREAAQYRAASGHLESALSLDPRRNSLRAQFADLTRDRLLRAERDRNRELADELAARLAAYDDDGHRRAALGAGAQIQLEVEPPGTAVSIERPGAAPQLLGRAPLPALTLAPGSLILAFEAPGRLATRLPVLLGRGEALRQRVALPAASTAPPGMIYVPAGRFLFGSTDSTDLRRGFLVAPPVHEIQTAAYYIGRNEVTFGQWIEFLDELAPDERRRRSPSAVNPRSSLTLTEVGPRRWRLELTPTTRTYSAETGQRLRYEHRTRRAEQDWTRFPVAAISYEDATAFAAWLDRTGRVPGARLCDEYEWERAARGADARTFPTGAALSPDAADIDTTYGRDPLAFGPDEVGSHPASRSPVGADDMAGNVWEWTRSVETGDGPVARGGGWYNAELSSRSVNREPGEPTQRHIHIGLRICATPHFNGVP